MSILESLEQFSKWLEVLRQPENQPVLEAWANTLDEEQRHLLMKILANMEAEQLNRQQLGRLTAPRTHSPCN